MPLSFSSNNVPNYGWSNFDWLQPFNFNQGFSYNFNIWDFNSGFNWGFNSSQFSNNDSFVKSKTSRKSPGELLKAGDERPFKYDEKYYTEDAVNKLEAKWKPVTRLQKGITHKFIQGVVAIAKKIRCNPDSLMCIINSESAFKAAQPTGLMGFVKSTRADVLGITDGTMERTSPEGQLKWMEKLLIESKKLALGKGWQNKDLSDGLLYSIVFVPGYVKDALNDKNQILVSADSSNKTKRKYYNNKINRCLDKENKGYITINDMTQRIRDKSAETTIAKYHLA